MHILILIAVIGLLGALVHESYADSDFTLDATGFGKINGKVNSASLQLFLQIPDSGVPSFENGKISFGDDLYFINKANVVFSDDMRKIRLNAETKNYSISAAGKIVLAIEDDSVYRLSGKTSNGNTFSTLARLKPSTLTPGDSEPAPMEKNEILLLVKHTERVEWKSPYKFTARTLDPKANPMPDFTVGSGYLDGVNISAIVTNSLGEVIKTSNGKTDKFGYYENSVIIPDNARTGIYKLTVTASGENYRSITREFTFVVNPLNTRPT